ncbi:hypothetical protein RvY_14213 [Ramazzottius varieornatus]|uniref:Uncharacterized protein n=1 Tax=Ramazzottius varieornatus TaxID=947166 RepID=A0A1D1VVM2_RAMVA|nr:hypothetical protein RvY_14213 [Ramazzottius varieornatus]
MNPLHLVPLQQEMSASPNHPLQKPRPSTARLLIDYVYTARLPLLDYVYNPRLKGLVNALEDCQRLFLRSINLAPASEDTSTERNCHRLRQVGLEPLVLKRIKASLILAYKMVPDLVPVSSPFFILILQLLPFPPLQVAHEQLQRSELTRSRFNWLDLRTMDGPPEARTSHSPSSSPKSGTISRSMPLPMKPFQAFL